MKKQCQVLSWTVMTLLAAGPVAAVQVDAAGPRVFLLDASHLQAIQQRVRAGDKDLAPAVAALIRDANEALRAGPFSVMNKDVTPPSGDKHDYMSRAPYYWPDPTKPDGLPYISRDGQRNPEVTKITDYDNMWNMAWKVETLTLAYYLAGNETYAHKAAEMIRAWFLDPATRMNPNFACAQGIPGINNGRGTGIIESLAFLPVVDSIGLLSGSSSWRENDERGIKEWFGRYLKWLRESALGRSESEAENNHGTYYDAQVADYALFLGDKDLAASILREAQTKRIARQIEPDGRQPLELARTISLHYSIYNLRGLSMLAKLGDKVDVDLWHYQTADGRSISRAIDFLIPYVTGEQKWPYQQISEYSMPKAYTVLRWAPVKYSDPRYQGMVSKFPELDPGDRDNLLIPKPANSKQELHVLLLDGPHLEATRQRIRGGDRDLAPAVAALVRDADEALATGRLSVMDKEISPPSGDKHDFISQGPYWWPDPNKPDGLPYVRRDGRRNPEINKLPDDRNMSAMAGAVETLSLAYYFTGNEIYAVKAAGLLRTWFLDPATRMNPNMQYGQGIPGITTGRGIGLIDSVPLTKVVDAVGLLAGSKAWMAADQIGLQSWFGEFLQWMLDSKNGRDEADALNNHGTYCDLQIASYALFVGKKDVATKTLLEACAKRIARQIEPDGRQPLELERTRSWSYSVMNLRGLMSLAKLGESAGVDLWNFQTEDGRSIRKALDYLLPFALGEREWPHEQITQWSPDDLIPLLRQAALKYADQRYRSLVLRARGLSPDSRIRLLQPELAQQNRSQEKRIAA